MWWLLSGPQGCGLQFQTTSNVENFTAPGMVPQVAVILPLGNALPPSSSWSSPPPNTEEFWLKEGVWRVAAKMPSKSNERVTRSPMSEFCRRPGLLGVKHVGTRGAMNCYPPFLCTLGQCHPEAPSFHWGPPGASRGAHGPFIQLGSDCSQPHK